MDEIFQQGFQGMQGFDENYQNSAFEDMPLSNDLLDCFSIESYEATAPGGLPSPNFSNPDLPGSGRQSPFLSSLSPFTSGSDFQQVDGDLCAHDGFFGSHQRLQESCTNTGSNTSDNHPSTNRPLSHARISSPETHVLQGEPSMTSSSHVDLGQRPSFSAPSDDSLCVSHQSGVSTVPSKSTAEQITPIWRPTSTHMPIAPKVANNTMSASAPANSQHSPTPKAQQFVRHPSNLRHQIHPELPQNSLLTAIATEDHITGPLPHTMSPSSNFTNHQESNASPPYGNYQTIHHTSNRPQPRRVTSAHNRRRGSPLLQNYKPFQESSLRSPLTSNSRGNVWEAEHCQIPQYPDPQPEFQQQFNRSPYVGHQYVSEAQGNHISSHSPENFLMQYSDSPNLSFMSQGTTDFGLHGLSPISIKRELSSPESGHLVSTPNLRSQMASPKPQKKRRVKYELKNGHDNEAAVDPDALRTTDLTNLDPTDQTNVAALIDAMHNTHNVEDNQGMQKTWDKVRRAKAFRIKEVCVELLILTKQAQEQNGNPLGDKKPINHYASFEKRFDALRETLMSQKTVCKHLIEPPYSFCVVDDPQNAKDRVINNRRVNYQKAEAIRLGREHLGEKGQGKGKPMLKSKKRVQAQLEDSQDDEYNSGDEPLSDAETDVLPHVLGPESARPNPRAPKRMKRSSNSTHHQELRGSIEDSYSPQAQYLEDPFAQDLQPNACSPDQLRQMLSDHNRMSHGTTASQQMPTLNQPYDFQSGNENGNSYFGDNSTAGSDSEGLGAFGY